MFGSSSSAFFNTWRHRGYPSKPYWGLSKHAAICPPNFFFVIWVTGWIGGKIWLPFSCKLLLKNGYFPDELTRGLYLMKKTTFHFWSVYTEIDLTTRPDGLWLPVMRPFYYFITSCYIHTLFKLTGQNLVIHSNGRGQHMLACQ